MLAAAATQPSSPVDSFFRPSLPSFSLSKLLTSVSASVNAVAGTAATRVSDSRRRAVAVEDEDEEEGRGNNSAAIGDDDKAAAPLVRPVVALAAAILRRRGGVAVAAAEAREDARCCSCALEEDAMPASIATIVFASNRRSGELSFFFPSNF